MRQARPDKTLRATAGQLAIQLRRMPLRGVSKPQFRLRVEDLRIFYDVNRARVEVLAIVEKSEATACLARAGEMS